MTVSSTVAARDIGAYRRRVTFPEPRDDINHLVKASRGLLLRDFSSRDALQAYNERQTLNGHEPGHARSASIHV